LSGSHSADREEIKEKMEIGSSPNKKGIIKTLTHLIQSYTGTPAQAAHT
jgi:hypothetical protein